MKGPVFVANFHLISSRIKQRLAELDVVLPGALLPRAPVVLELAVLLPGLCPDPILVLQFRIEGESSHSRPTAILLFGLVVPRLLVAAVELTDFPLTALVDLGHLSLCHQAVANPLLICPGAGQKVRLACRRGLLVDQRLRLGLVMLVIVVFAFSHWCSSVLLR